MYLAARRSNAGGNRILGCIAGLLRRGVGGDLPEPGQRLRVGGDDVPEMYRAARSPPPHLHCLCQGRDGDPHEGQRQRNKVRGASIRSAPGRSSTTSKQHPPGHVLDDLVVEIGAGGCLGDPHEAFTARTCPVISSRARCRSRRMPDAASLLQEHVDLAVEPRTSRHAASLPSLPPWSSANIRTAGGGNPAVLGPLSPSGCSVAAHAPGTVAALAARKLLISLARDPYLSRRASVVVRGDKGTNPVRSG